MSITFTVKDRLQSFASWHSDRKVNESQARLLANDARVKHGQLLSDSIEWFLGRRPERDEVKQMLNERPEPETELIWVCWGDAALAVKTHPRSSVKDCRYYLTWHYKCLVSATAGRSRNVVGRN